jgi:transcriptional regulator with XRE-family HTH domain
MGTPLGDFIRAQRDAADPLGLATSSRRRVPGLRRTELAAAAGISVEYLVRIEQGRDRNPSVSVLNALAGALALDSAELSHLRYLAKITGGACPGPAVQPNLDVRPTVLAVLAQLEPAIAMVTNRLGDILAYTDAFAALAGPSGLLDAIRPNLTAFVFTDDRARQLFPDWDSITDQLVFDLWRGPSAERSAEFQAGLAPRAGTEFTRRLRQHRVPPQGVLRWIAPGVGDLRFEREFLELPATDAQQLVVFLPADAATADVVERMRRSSAAPLRAVR